MLTLTAGLLWFVILLCPVQGRMPTRNEYTEIYAQLALVPVKDEDLQDNIPHSAFTLSKCGCGTYVCRVYGTYNTGYALSCHQTDFMGTGPVDSHSVLLYSRQGGGLGIRDNKMDHSTLSVLVHCLGREFLSEPQ